MYPFFKKEVIIAFYKNLKFTNFESITEERLQELNKIIESHRTWFTSQTIGYQSLMTLVAERLTISYKVYGLRNGDEKAYFYMKMVDPTLQFLEIHESANMTYEIRNLCLLNFKIYDKYLIFLEKTYNNRFHEYDPDDLWSRESIKR